MKSEQDKKPDLIVEWTGWIELDRPGNAHPNKSTWTELVDTVADPDDLPEGGKATLMLWNLGTFTDGYRSGENHLHSSGVLIDYDSDPSAKPGERGYPELSADDLRQCWGPYKFLAHTTPSHRPGQARWRIAIPLSRPVSAGEYRAVAKWLTSYVTVP